MPETENRNHFYASTICRIQMFQSLNTRTLCIKKSRSQHVKHSHQTLSFWIIFKVSSYETVNSRGYKRENLVFVTVSKIYYRNRWLRKGRQRSGKEQQMSKKTQTCFIMDIIKHFQNSDCFHLFRQLEFLPNHIARPPKPNEYGNSWTQHQPVPDKQLQTLFFTSDDITHVSPKIVHFLCSSSKLRLETGSGQDTLTAHEAVTNTTVDELRQSSYPLRKFANVTKCTEKQLDLLRNFLTNSLP